MLCEGGACGGIGEGVLCDGGEMFSGIEIDSDRAETGALAAKPLSTLFSD